MDERSSLPGARRLLAVTAVPPWPMTDGYSLRAGNFLKQLAVDRELTVVSPPPDSRPSGRAPAPVGIEWTLVEGLPATSALPWRDEQRLLVEQVERLVTERSFSAALLWNGTEFLAGEVPDLPPAVADRIDCEALQAWRGRTHREGFRQKLRSLRRGVEMALYERRALRNLEALVVTGPDDARALRLITGHRRVRVVPNGVELPDLEDLPGEGDVPTVIFTGVLRYPPNVEAARYFTRRVWPEVQRAVPNARLVIAGRSPGREVRKLGETSGVTIHGDVPDLMAEIRKAWVAVAPMQSGSGIKNKVLEAWAAARPVVMSELATNGLKLEEAPHALTELVCGDGEDMARTVTALLEDAPCRERVGRQGRTLAEQEHGWEAAAQELARVLGNTADETRQSAEDPSSGPGRATRNAMSRANL